MRAAEEMERQAVEVELPQGLEPQPVEVDVEAQLPQPVRLTPWLSDSLQPGSS